MFKCIVGLYGLPVETTKEHSVEIELEDEAYLTDLIAALGRKIPQLVGTVINARENKLEQYFTFNINGHFYIDENIRITNGDQIALLAFATGG